MSMFLKYNHFIEKMKKEGWTFDSKHDNFFVFNKHDLR